uniref:Beta-amylase n=1 Tax=Kalanchoe fedtschenkoi TaxID=63787 RepID=A0A7N0V802_KALFE
MKTGNEIGAIQHLDPTHHQQQQQQPPSRRPRGFAASAAIHAPGSTSACVKGKKREREKERTKLRERHRRAVTSRMLAGLRQYGNFPLPARADMNDVLAALARQAGWTVEADGTTYRHTALPNPVVQMEAYPVWSIDSPVSATSLGKASCSLDGLHSLQVTLRGHEGTNLSPVASFDSAVISERDTGRSIDTYTSNSLEADQLLHSTRFGEDQSDFAGTPYIPVYIALAPDIINNLGQLIDPDGIRQELSHIKSLNADGVVVLCWWGIVENWIPQKYEWMGYKLLFNIIREFKLKLQVVMAFHDYGIDDSGNVLIPLPQWVLDIGRENPDIFFTDRKGERNMECLTLGIDKERALNKRTGIEVYYDFMRNFRTEFDDLFSEGIVYAVEIGLGASGELKYPAFSERSGWRYPGIGEFQCYDKYLQQSLKLAAKLRGHPFWAKAPDNCGHYNSKPFETGFFHERGDYDSYYGRFFLQWYTQCLIDHADNILSLASLIFEGTHLVIKIPAIFWWYKTVSHAAELTAGYYNPTNKDGYSPLFEVLNKHGVTVKFAHSGLLLTSQESDEALADPESLSWQVLNSAWERGLTVAGENPIGLYDKEGYMRVVETAKPRNDPDRHRRNEQM